MFVILLYYQIVNNLEEKEKEIAMLKANEQVLNQQLQNSIEESNHFSTQSNIMLWFFNYFK